mgnify:CR=1 FL=1
MKNLIDNYYTNPEKAAFSKKKATSLEVAFGVKN